MQRGGAENQKRVLEQRSLGIARAERRIDAALDQPRQSDAGEIGGDQRNNAEDEEISMTVD